MATGDRALRHHGLGLLDSPDNVIDRHAGKRDKAWQRERKKTTVVVVTPATE